MRKLRPKCLKYLLSHPPQPYGRGTVQSSARHFSSFASDDRGREGKRRGVPGISELLFPTERVARMEKPTLFQRPPRVGHQARISPTECLLKVGQWAGRPATSEFFLILLPKLWHLPSSYTHINPLRVAFQKGKLRFREAQQLGQCCGGRLRLSSQQASVNHSLCPETVPVSCSVHPHHVGCPENPAAALGNHPV